MIAGSGPWSRSNPLRRNAWLLALPITLISSLTAVGSASAATSYKVIGVVTCPGGQAVTGVWVQSSAGGSKFAKRTAFPNNKRAAYYTATFNTTFPTQVRLHVGCGGSEDKWGSENRSKNIKVASGSSRVVNASCDGKGGCSYAPNKNSGPTSPNPVGPSNKCQCTYFAAQKWKDMTGRYPDWQMPDGSGRIGNAKDWDENAANYGWRVSSFAQPRALFVENSGTFGHVGYVKDVRVSNGKLQIRIEDQNSDNSNTCFIRGVDTAQWIDATTTMKFIVAPPKVDA